MTFWTWFWIIIAAIVFSWVKIKDNEMKQYQRVEEYKHQEGQFKKLVKEAMKEE